MVRWAQRRRIGHGHSGALSIGDGQLVEREKRRGRRIRTEIDVGPGCRIYFGKDGDRLVILLGGSTKQRQQQAIETAQERWVDYRRRKTKEKI